MAERPSDPASVIRPEDLAELRRAAKHADARVAHPNIDSLYTHASRLRDAYVRLEREAAERETALAEAREHADGMARAPYGEFEAMRQRAEAAEARVREVEAERDRLAESNAAYSKHRATIQGVVRRAEEAEATVARQAETLREIAEWPFNSTTGGGLGEPARLARAVLASPEAQTVASTGTPIPRDLGASIVDDHAHDLRMLASPEAPAAEPPEKHGLVQVHNGNSWHAYCECGWECWDRPSEEVARSDHEKHAILATWDDDPAAALPAVDAPPPEQFAQVHKSIIGRALVLLDEVPRATLRTNQEYAHPGTGWWLVEAKKLLCDLTAVDAPPEPTT